MKIVLDTNVLISSQLNSFGDSAQILRLVFSGDLTLMYDGRILEEYKEVLNRPKFHFQGSSIGYLLNYFKSEGECVTARPLPYLLADIDDQPFLEVAVTGQAEFLITGNTKHFPEEKKYGIRIITPSQFMCLYRDA